MTESKISRRQFNQLIFPGAIGLSAALASSSYAQGFGDFKAKVLRVGFQVSGDLVKVSGVLLQHYCRSSSAKELAFGS